MPRTTVDIDASVLRDLKKRQKKDQRPLGHLISELLAEALRSHENPPPEFKWIAKDLKPRVDLDDKDAVWSILDRE